MDQLTWLHYTYWISPKAISLSITYGRHLHFRTKSYSEWLIVTTASRVPKLPRWVQIIVHERNQKKHQGWWLDRGSQEPKVFFLNNPFSNKVRVLPIRKSTVGRWHFLVVPGLFSGAMFTNLYINLPAFSRWISSMNTRNPHQKLQKSWWCLPYCICFGFDHRPRRSIAESCLPWPSVHELIPWARRLNEFEGVFWKIIWANDENWWTKIKGYHATSGFPKLEGYYSINHQSFGQIIATSAEVNPNDGSLGREFPQNALNSGRGIVVIWWNSDRSCIKILLNFGTSWYWRAS